MRKEYDAAPKAAADANEEFVDKTGYTEKNAEYQNICDNLRLVSKEANSAENAYNADTATQNEMQRQTELLRQIKDYAALVPGSWESAYKMGQAETEGESASQISMATESVEDKISRGEKVTAVDMLDTVPMIKDTPLVNWLHTLDKGNPSDNPMVNPQRGAGRKHAFGLSRVPFDDYPILAHEGEQLLTAREAREYRAQQNRREAFPAYIPPSVAAGTGEKNVNLTLNVNMSGLTVRDDSDVDKIASALAEKLRIQQMIG